MARIESTTLAMASDSPAAIVAAMDEPPYWAVIHPSGAISMVHGRPRLVHLQRAVRGYIEAVPHDGPFTAYCNEEGKLDGLPPNIPATRFLGLTHDILVGPVVLIGPPNDEGEDTALPADVRMRLVREFIEA